MKKIVCFIFTIVICMYGAFMVRADVIWEPEDPFFRKHAEEMEHINRVYTANGPEGEVILYKSPESSKVIDIWKNGTTVLISWIYKDGEGIVWGANDSGGNKDGWVPMEYMQVVYDSIAFQEDYEDEIVEQTGALDKTYVGKTVYLWDYPGAESYSTIEVSSDMQPPSYDKVYKDEEGRSWGNIAYYYGYKDTWLCIDFPEETLEQLYPDGTPVYEAETDEKEFGTERIVPKSNGQTVIYTAVELVCLTVVITAALLMFLKKEKVR